MKKVSWVLAAKILVLIGIGGAVFYDAKVNFVDWRTADRSSAKIAPNPKDEKEAVVQVYAARTYNWRGYFAVHSWIATKEKNAENYTIYQVVGFYLNHRGTAVDIKQDVPDRKWYGAAPDLLRDLRGAKAEAAIPKVMAAAKAYPYAKIYSAWPGPNSNTFVSYILRQVPELRTDLPPTAIGKDFIGYKRFFSRTESGTGWQFSVMGLAGISLGLMEGLEINLLGLNFGIDILRPAIKLPLIGRLGMSEKVSD